MIETPLSVPRVILYEGPRAEPLECELRNGLLQGLLERGYAVRRIRGPEVSLDCSAQAEEPLILGRFGGRLPEPGNNVLDLPVRLRDITGLALEDVLALVETLCRGYYEGQWQTLEAVVPGHRLLALHQLHAVPELLPVRRVWGFSGRQDPGPA